MTNEEKAKMIAKQCKPCSEDFYKGIEQGVLLSLNAEKENLSKAEKWDALDKKISTFYGKEDEETGGFIDNKDEFNLDSIGEVAAHAFGWM